jgi:hypothetical protein
MKNKKKQHIANMDRGNFKKFLVLGLNG